MKNTTQHTNKPMTWKSWLISLGGAVIVAACGSVASTSPGSPASPTGAAPMPTSSPTASAALLCRQITSLRASLIGLTHMTGHTASARQLAGNVTHAEAELAGLKGSAGAFSAQASQLGAELSQIAQDAHKLAMHYSPAELNALETAVGTLRAHVQPLVKEMQAACPNN